MSVRGGSGRGRLKAAWSDRVIRLARRSSGSRNTRRIMRTAHEPRDFRAPVYAGGVGRVVGVAASADEGAVRDHLRADESIAGRRRGRVGQDGDDGGPG